MEYKIPKIQIPEALKETLNKSENIINELNEKRDAGLNQNLDKKIKQRLLIQSVWHSNAIEGNQLTLPLRETEIILSGMEINERPLKDEIEAQSLSNATEYLYKLIAGDEPLTKRTLLELHGLILANIPGMQAGQFRNEDVQIKHASHTPPSFLTVESHIGDMFKWMNRNAHKHSPLEMASILHHWLTWIHPFGDGNGRAARLFLNFFLLQKGYPEIIVKISDRDNYYDALIAADNGDIVKLIELFSQKISETIDFYEQMINEEDRRKEWGKMYEKSTEEQAQKEYEKINKQIRYGYEVWKSQIHTFLTIFEENLAIIDDLIPEIEITPKKYDIISFDQYLDILEGRKVTNTWCLFLNMFNHKTKNRINIIFYFSDFTAPSKKRLALSDFGKQIQSISGKKERSNHYVKLYISARKEFKECKLKDEIDLVNVGTWDDQLSFGTKDRSKNGYRIKTETGNPEEVVRHFIDQILNHYLDINI